VNVGGLLWVTDTSAGVIWQSGEDGLWLMSITGAHMAVTNEMQFASWLVENPMVQKDAAAELAPDLPDFRFDVIGKDVRRPLPAASRVTHMEKRSIAG